jgi:hypothetical protein
VYTVMALIIVSAILLVIAGFVVASKAARQRELELQEQKRQERLRVEACGETVLFFANNLGYIARSVISKDEIGRLIDNGISPEKLATTIATRIEEAEGLILGYQVFDHIKFNVKLPLDSRQRHLYIVGKSGSGKTNLMRTMIFQDMLLGNGLGVIAPEQEMIFEEILPYVPDHRIDDVILFDPSDPNCPSFNPLHLDEGEDVDVKVDEVLTIFSRIISGNSGPRMEELLRQALYALIGREGVTLLDIERLLDRTDPSFRTYIINSCKDPQQAHFWQNVYPSFPKDAHLPITNRLGRFLRPKVIRNILCNPKQSLNFRQVMDEGKILLFNLSDGILGEQNSQLLGQLVVSKFQLAVMSRAQMPKESRRQFFLYVDEFQTFTGTAATSYEKILSRARKYKLGLILAHQQTGQIPTQLLKEILGNVSTSICFLVSREDSSKFSKELITTQNGEIINIPEEEVLRLKVGQCWCKIGQQAFLMHTYLADQHPDRNRVEYIVQKARFNYGSTRNLVVDSEPALAQGTTYQDTTSTKNTPTKSSKKVLSKTVNKAQIIASPPKTDDLDDLDPANIFDS